MTNVVKGVLIYGFGGVVLAGAPCFTAGLQELASDQIPELARDAKVELPLSDPRIEIGLQRMTLALYDGDVMIKRYDIGYGQQMPGKLDQRADSTPVGTYRIVSKDIRKDVLARGSRFMAIDFPSLENAQDAYVMGVITHADFTRIHDAHALGHVPPGDTALGGPVGIQGNYFFFRPRRFTDGSIALSNGDVNELFEHVPLGTPVIIDY